MEQPTFKVSRYLTLVDDKSPCKSMILFNARTGGRYKIDTPAKEEVVNIIKSPNSTKNTAVKDFLISESILLPSNTDELELVKDEYRKAKSSQDSLMITFVMTYGCNLGCKYCYQNHTDEELSEMSFNKGVQLIKKHISNYKKLKVHWFGGEPLLNVSVLTDWSNKIKQLCHSKGKEYYGAVTTNGSLFTSDVANNLKLSGIKQIQITLDGEEDDHNYLRTYKSGAPTYDKLVEAILIAIDFGFTTFVRINLSPYNVSKYPKMLDDLLLAGVDPNKALLYINELKCHSDDFDNSLYFSNLTQYGNSLVFALKEAKKRGFRLPSIRPIGVNCDYSKPSSFFIGTDGNLYFCTTESEKPIAYIDDNGCIYDQTSRMFKVKNSEPWHDPICSACKHLPLCMGGCLYLEERRRNKCNPQSVVLEELLRLEVET